MIETLAPDRADEPFREGVLPRTVGRGQHFTDAHALHALPKSETVDAIAIVEEIGRRGVVREGVDELLGARLLVAERGRTQRWTPAARHVLFFTRKGASPTPGLPGYLGQ